MSNTWTNDRKHDDRIERLRHKRNERGKLYNKNRGDWLYIGGMKCRGFKVYVISP